MAGRCFVCGTADAETRPVAAGAKSKPLLAAHERCFCLHQVYNVLTQDSEQPCPAGAWLFDWRQRLPQHVGKDEYAALQGLLAEVRSAGRRRWSADTLTRVAHAGTGAAGSHRTH